MKRLNEGQIRLLKSLEKETEENLIVPMTIIFNEETPPILEKMKECLDTDNLQELSFYAHKLKSSAFNLGATDMIAVCLKIETEGKKKSNINYKDLIKDLEQQFTEVAGELEEINKEPA